MASTDKATGVLSDVVAHLAAVFRYMLPGVLVMGAAYLAYPEWFKRLDLQSKSASYRARCDHDRGREYVVRSESLRLAPTRGPCSLLDQEQRPCERGYAGSGPAQLALAILADYFGDKPGGKALADALYQPFKFAVIMALPQERDWKMSFEEVGIILCRLLTDKPDLFSRIISSLESAVYEEMFSRQGEEDESFSANFSEAAISERLAAMLSEAFPMSRAFAGSLVEQYYAGLNTQQHT